MEECILNDSLPTPTTSLWNNLSSVGCNESYLPLSSLFINIYLSAQGSNIIISTVINCVIIAAICCSKRLQTVPNVFIASLAVSDLITSSSFGMAEFVIIFNEKSVCFLSEPFKCARVFISCLGVFANTLNHLMISIERWLYIARPFLHQRIVTRRLTACSVLFVWVVSVGFNVNMAINSCGINTFRYSVIIGVVRPLFYFSVCSLMISIYTHIFFLTRRAIRNINKTRPLGLPNDDQGITKPLRSLKSTWKNIRMLVTVFGAFFVTLTPCICADIYDYSTPYELHKTVAGKVIDMVWFTHYSVNFFIYAVQDRTFRAVLKMGIDKMCQPVLHRCCKR